MTRVLTPRTIANNLAQLSVFTLKKDGVLTDTISFYASKRLEVGFSGTEQWIDLQRTPCYFGRFRYWFSCPNLWCGKRVAILYWHEGSFSCRTCLNLTYKSNNQNPKIRDNALFKHLGDLIKIRELEDQIQKPFYNQKPTRKQVKLNHLRLKVLKLIWSLPAV